MNVSLLGTTDAIQFSLEVGLCNVVLEYDHPKFCKALQCYNALLSLSSHLICYVICQKWEFYVVSKLGNRVIQSIAAFDFSNF